MGRMGVSCDKAGNQKRESLTDARSMALCIGLRKGLILLKKERTVIAQGKGRRGCFGRVQKKPWGGGGGGGKVWEKGS